jgi:hypothetical protein
MCIHNNEKFKIKNAFHQSIKSVFILFFDFNYGNGFLCAGKDPIVRPFEKKNYVQEQIKYEPVNLTKIGMEVNHYYEPKTKDEDCPF